MHEIDQLLQKQRGCIYTARCKVDENSTHSGKIKVNTILVLALVEAVPCSSFQLWIAALTRPADSMWQLVTSRQCTSTHDLCLAPQVSLSGSSGGLRRVRWLPRRPRLYRKVTGSCGGVRVEGREEQLTRSNENLLSVSGLRRPEKWKRHESAACVRCLCCNSIKLTLNSVWQWEGWAPTAATSCDNNVTVNLGLRRQCG